MFFHWLKLYGKPSGRATADAFVNASQMVASKIVDAAFTNAKASTPDIFNLPSSHEPSQQAKFEHVCAWLALEFVNLDDDRKARAVVEEMIDRLEIGLREAGVSDMKVGVHVRKYASALHGRVRRYASLLQEGNHLELTKALASHGVGSKVTSQLQSRYKVTTTHVFAKKGIEPCLKGFSIKNA